MKLNFIHKQHMNLQ